MQPEQRHQPHLKLEQRHGQPEQHPQSHVQPEQRHQPHMQLEQRHGQPEQLHQHHSIVTPRSSNSKFPEFMLLRGDTIDTAAIRHF